MKLVVLIVLISFSIGISAQVGITSETPNAVAELDVVSPANNTGVLIPTFTDAEIITGSALATNQPPHGSLIYNSSRGMFMYNAGTGASQLWTFVGSIPVIDNIANLSGNEIEGDIRYCATNNKIYFYNGTVWKELVE